ncbi:hypothetical protein [Actinoallomurus iriomotensis]|uniref:SH3 domain-containing protein n=1 Tax=Actinoallomurus iriomotensis TaxID=478107 RepID=A0A9W6RRA8_9ACTN|nr:hypothetical protein [Actinoallomurus iriomotensis]GLY80506.1 hypothetical protein Airi01_087730 [Actinoallomurus iriomotensis]
MNPRRTTAAVLGAVVLTAGLATISASPAYADPCHGTRSLELDRTFTIDARGGTIVDVEGSGRGIDLHPGDSIEVLETGGDIWAGVWFTGRNGPRGWEGWPAPNDGKWPLPGANLYSLIGEFRARQTGYPQGAFFLPGTGCIAVPSTGTTVLYLEPNDQTFSDNDGAFTAHLRVWKHV